MASQKPAWARSEEENDLAEEEEIESLLDFATTLDYDRYIEDLEIREALKLVQDRVDQLERIDASLASEADKAKLAALRQQQADMRAVYSNDEFGNAIGGDAESLDMIAARRKAKRAARQAIMEMGSNGDISARPDWDGSTRVFDEDGLYDDGKYMDHDAAMAERSKALRAVHSNQSLKAVMKRERKAAKARSRVSMPGIEERGFGGGLDGDDGASVALGQLALDPPKVIVNADRNGATEVHASNLPFLYRHPSV